VASLSRVGHPQKRKNTDGWKNLLDKRDVDSLGLVLRDPCISG
jgi:hypothetical protein